MFLTPVLVLMSATSIFCVCVCVCVCLCACARVCAQAHGSVFVFRGVDYLFDTRPAIESQDKVHWGLCNIRFNVLFLNTSCNTGVTMSLHAGKAMGYLG